MSSQKLLTFVFALQATENSGLFDVRGSDYMITFAEALKSAARVRSINDKWRFPSDCRGLPDTHL